MKNKYLAGLVGLAIAILPSMSICQDISADKTYVQKMVGLGHPELAFVQAVNVSRQDPDNALAWAVQAYVCADRGEPYDAFVDLLKAVKLNRNDDFIFRTAGQLLAWYDSPLVDRAAIDDAMRVNLGVTRIHCTRSHAFVEAYR